MVNKEKTKDVKEPDTSGKVYELLIPSWNAAIPADWNLEFAQEKNSELEPAAGKVIYATKGSRIKGGPPEMIKTMLEQGMIKEGA